MGMPTKLFSSIFLHSLAFDPNNSNRKQEKNQATIWKLKVDDNKDEDDVLSSHLPPPQPNSQEGFFFGGGGGACCSPQYWCSQNQLAARKLRSWCCSRSRGERKIYGRVGLLIVGLFMFCLFPVDLDIFFTNKISVISTI